MTEPVQDWTRGGAGIAYQQCGDCRRSWYFERSFCPNCGSGRIDLRQASGQGVVEAVTVVHRHPGAPERAALPYAIGLVRLAEGFSVMAHVAAGTRIGDAVSAGFTCFAGRTVPLFGRAAG